MVGQSADGDIHFLDFPNVCMFCCIVNMLVTFFEVRILGVLHKYYS